MNANVNVAWGCASDETDGGLFIHLFIYFSLSRLLPRLLSSPFSSLLFLSSFFFLLLLCFSSLRFDLQLLLAPCSCISSTLTLILPLLCTYSYSAYPCVHVSMCLCVYVFPPVYIAIHHPSIHRPIQSNLSNPSITSVLAVNSTRLSTRLILFSSMLFLCDSFRSPSSLFFSSVFLLFCSVLFLSFPPSRDARLGAIPFTNAEWNGMGNGMEWNAARCKALPLALLVLLFLGFVSSRLVSSLLDFPFLAPFPSLSPFPLSPFPLVLSFPFLAPSCRPVPMTPPPPPFFFLELRASLPLNLSAFQNTNYG